MAIYEKKNVFHKTVDGDGDVKVKKKNNALKIRLPLANNADEKNI